MLTSAAIFLVIGFAILIYSGDCLVRGALAASLKTNISPLLTGILIVGLGTSMPEFLIGLSAASTGNPGLAHGNIIGSNIANILLVLALPAIIFPINTDAPRMKLTAVCMLLATAAWVAITLTIGLTQMVGFAFLGTLAVYALVAWMINRNKEDPDDTVEEKKILHTPAWRMVTLILIGLVGLPLGSRLLVDGGITLGHELHVDEAIIGLTLLAVGTSLPELGAGIAAAVRKESDVAMGNILGANIFNILGVGGTVAVLAPTAHVAPEFTGYSNWAMLAASVLITIVIMVQRRVGLVVGIFFLLLYALYIVGLTQGWSFEVLRNSILVPAASMPPA